LSASLRAYELHQELETVHFRHHEIEQDEVWLSLGHTLQRHPTIFSLNHRPPSFSRRRRASPRIERHLND
jgi:hypothetical protein